MFTAIATSIAAATDLSAFGAGAVFVVVGLLVIIAGYPGAVAADNLPAASSSSSSTVR